MPPRRADHVGNVPVELKKLVVGVDSLEHYPGNARHGALEEIKESLTRNGQYRPIVVNKRNNQVLAGNHTLQAARELGWTGIAATFVDADADQAKRIVLVDNRTNDLASYDDAALADLLQELGGDFEGTGFTGFDLDELLAGLESGYKNRDKDAAPALTESDTERGAIFELGDHRLICGDATDLTDALLVAPPDTGVNLMWTDPPYGVDYEGKTKDRLTIQNDGAGTLYQLLIESFQVANRVLAESAPVYVTGPPGPRIAEFIRAFETTGWDLRQLCIWIKDQFVMGHNDYHYRHEPLLLGYVPGPGKRGRGGVNWFGDNAQSSVFEIDRPKASTDHPTMKPVELIERCLANSTRAGMTVYDPFVGSGSTIIACETLRRKCIALELDPGYCDVAVKRWEKFTGKRAVVRLPDDTYREGLA